MKKLLFVLMIVALFVSVSLPKVSYAAENTNELEKFEREFISNLEVQANSEDPIVSKNAIENLEAYKKFTEIQKKQFFNIISSPEMIDQTLVISETKPTNIKSSFASYATTSSTASKKISRNFNFTIMGIKVYGIHLELSYKVSAARVTSTSSMSTYITYSYNPLASFTEVDRAHYKNSVGQAYAKAKYKYAMNPFKGLNFQAGVQGVSIGGDGVGNLVYYNAWKE